MTEPELFWRGLRVSLRVTWGGWAAIALPPVLALLWLFSRLTNPWDVVLFSTTDHEIALIILPVYLLILQRDLRRAWESLIGFRLGRTQTWWAVHVGVAGISALIVCGGVATLAVVVPLVCSDWSWQWGAYALGKIGPAALHSAPWQPAWRWSLEALALLTLCLWAAGTLAQVLGLWWRSPWMAFVAVALVAFLSITVEGTDAQGLLWWLPGAQFALAQHGPGSMPVAWTIGYAVALLIGSIIAGSALVVSSPWDIAAGGVP